MARTTTKTTTTRSLSSATSASAAAAEATEAEEAQTEEAQTEDLGEESVAPAVLRKKELIDRVVETSGMKKKDVKPVVEAMLTVLGAALSAEEMMQLPPLGKIQVKRKKELSNGELMITRVRRSAAQTGAPTPPLADPLAEAAE